MKQNRILFVLLASIFTALFAMTANAQQQAIFNWQNNGDFNAFLYSDVDSITYSMVDLNGRTHPNVVIQEVWTPDSVYRIPISSVDSVTFRAPDPVMKSGLFHISGEHFPYVTEVTASSVTFIASIPPSMLPSEGQIVISDSVYVEPFPHGFAGRVINIVRAGDIVRIECEDVNLEDIYESLVCVGKVVTYDDENGAPSRAPNRIGGEDCISVPFRSFSFDIEKESNKVKVSVQPQLTFDYAIRILEGHNDHFRFVVKSGLDCDFNYNWNKPFHPIDTIIFPLKKPIEIHTPVPGLHAFVNIGGFLDFGGSATIDLSHHLHLESHMGYDSWERDNGRDGLIFKFIKDNTLSGTAKVNATLSAGLAIRIGVCLVSETIDEANLTLKVGPRVSGNIEFNTNMTQAPTWENFSNTHITLEPITAKLSGGVKVFTHEKNWDLWELPIGEWFPVLGQRTAYVFPKLSKPYLPSPGLAVVPLGLSMTALTSDISRDLIFPIEPGIELYKDGLLVDQIFSEKSYKVRSEWKIKNLQMELWNKALNKGAYPAGIYTAKPIFKIFNRFILPVDSISTVTIPNPLSGIPSSVTVKKGQTETISFTGGWGTYTLFNSNPTVCSSTRTGSSITIKGLKNGIDTLVFTDVRPIDIKYIYVTVVDEPKINVNPASLAFGTVPYDSNVSNAPTKTFTVTGENLTGDLSVSSSSSMFSVSPTGITRNADGSVSQSVTVKFLTYKPGAVGTQTATITVSGGGAESKTVSVSGTCVKKPEITVNPTSLAFGSVPYDSNVSNAPTKTFTVTGKNLTGDLSVSSSSTMFSVSPTGITRNADGSVSQSVTVKFLTYKPGAVGTQTATITVSGGGAESKTVNVSGTCFK